MTIRKHRVSQSQHVSNQNNIVLHQASKGNIILASERGRIHTQHVTKNH